MGSSDDEKYNAEETQDRLQKILQGAFSGPPTPLKDIPTRTGEFRAIRLTPKSKQTKKKKHRTKHQKRTPNTRQLVGSQ